MTLHITTTDATRLLAGEALATLTASTELATLSGLLALVLASLFGAASSSGSGLGGGRSSRSCGSSTLASVVDGSCSSTGLGSEGRGSGLSGGVLTSSIFATLSDGEVDTVLSRTVLGDSDGNRGVVRGGVDGGHAVEAIRKTSGDGDRDNAVSVLALVNTLEERKLAESGQ